MRVETTERFRKGIAVTVAAVTLLTFTSCGSLGISDKERAKYYKATDLIESANVDYGNTYDKVVVAYFNSAIDPDKYLADLQNYVTEGLVSQEIYDECSQYKEYQESMDEDPYVYYTTNGNPKTLMNFGLDSLSLIEQLERGWIGHWMYAIPDDAMKDVLRAYKSNNLLLDFDNGNYQIVDYKTDVYGNADGENDLSRTIDYSDMLPEYNNEPVLLGDETVDPSEMYTPETAEQDPGLYGEDIHDENEYPEVSEYTIARKDGFANFIVYRVIEPNTQKQGNFTVVIEDGTVVSIDGTF